MHFHVGKFEDTKEVIRRIEEGQKIQWPKQKDKRAINDIQNITQKTKDLAIQTPLKNQGRVSSSCSTCDTHPDTVKRHEII
jgi:hypothetical protein